MTLLLDFYKSTEQKDILMTLLENQIKKILDVDELDYDECLCDAHTWYDKEDEFITEYESALKNLVESGSDLEF